MKYSINDYPPYRAGKHSVFTSSENGCTHCGKNMSQCMVRQFKIDGGVFTDGTTPRCDYLLLNDDRHTSYYIELKGSDLPKAIEQLEHTISMISPSIPDYKVFRRIVYRTGSHKIRESKVVLWQRKHGSSVQIKARKLEENI